MIHYDHPAAADLSEKEGIDSADISDLPFQQPFTDDEAIIWGELLYFEQGKKESAHLVGAAVVFLIIDQGLVIAIGRAGFADENQGVVLPVAFHEAIDAPFIPGGGLIGHHLPDGGLVFWRHRLLFWRHRLCKAGRCQQQQAGADQSFLHALVLAVNYLLRFHFPQQIL